MIRNPHTYINLNQTIHRFVKQNANRRINGRGEYSIYRCEICGISGFRYGPSVLITIHKQYGQRLFSKCKRKEMVFKNPTGKHVKIHDKLIPCNPCPDVPLMFPDYRDRSLSVGSIHRIINPANGMKNDSRGIWVQGTTEPIKLNNHEFLFYKPQHTGGRKNFNTSRKKSGRTNFK